MAMTAATTVAEPIKLHSENPRWFSWQGEATALITSAEHYGAVINLDFDYHTYLAALERDGMNYTRIFAGTYVEPEGAFNIANNTLAPADGRFLAPWPRSDEPGYAGGGNKFDLNQFDADYLLRLNDFISTAAKHNVIVELTFFTSTYSEKQWAVHPFNPANNIQSIEVRDWKKLPTVDNGPEVMAIQEKLVRWLVRELNHHDNLFYEIQNEPWSDNHTFGAEINPMVPERNKWFNTTEMTTPEAIAWQRRIAGFIAEEERTLPQTHLIAQNVANFRLPVHPDDIAPEISIINFHYAYPEAVTWNRGQRRVIGYDESGFMGQDDTTYRRQAWNFIMSGGGIFNNLDYSFYVGSEDGLSDTSAAPGGGGITLRTQLRTLSDFLHSVDLATLLPDPDFIRNAPGLMGRCLSQPGAHYLIYLEGRRSERIEVKLPVGSWQVEWIDPVTGFSLGQSQINSIDSTASLPCPPFESEAAVRIVRSGFAD
ncbi:MAG: hypothetical protein SynsKO_15510 [Synoicihabitans sp.]